MMRTQSDLKPPTVPHAVTSVDGGVMLNEYEYDANGNMTQRAEFGGERGYGFYTTSMLIPVRLKRLAANMSNTQVQHKRGCSYRW
jgi:hypothetical protein